MTWYVVVEGGEAVGPVEDDLIERGILTGKIPLQSQICAVGDTEWKSLASVPMFAQAMRAVAPPPPSPGRTNPPPPMTPRAEFTSLSDIFPLATAAPPFIRSPSPQQTFPRQSNVPADLVGAGTGRSSYVPPAPQQQPYAQPSPPMNVGPATMPPTGRAGATQPPQTQGMPGGAGFASYTTGDVFFGPPRGQLLAGVILTSVAAVFWFVVVLVRILYTVNNPLGEISAGIVFNVAVVGLDIWIVAALWLRKRAGYTFGLATHGINAALGLYQLFGSTPFLILIVPVHAFAIATIWAARHELVSPGSSPSTPSTAKIAAQRLADLDTTRVLLGIAGVVAVAVSILFLIFLYRTQ